MHIYIYTYIHYVCNIHTYIHTNIHTYIHIPTYTHIHKYLCPIIRFWSRDLITKVLVLVSRPGGQGLGLGLETWWPRSWSWSRDLVAKVLVLVSRPGGQGLGLGLELFSKVLITSLLGYDTVLLNSNRDAPIHRL